MRDNKAFGNSCEQLEKACAPDTRFVTRTKSIRQSVEKRHQVIDLPNSASLVNLPVAIQNANRDVLCVNVQSNVKHKCLSKSVKRRPYTVSQYD